MNTGSKIISQMNQARKALGSAGRAALAFTAGAVVTAGNIGRIVKGKAAELNKYAKNQSKKNSGEVVVVKKSTVVALLVALAAVAGVLGALYVYVLRREKELDEYEQLLFSEDFEDDYTDSFEDEAVPAEEPGKAADAK